MQKWEVVQSYLVNAPAYYEAETDDDLKQQLQNFADAKKRKPAIGNLAFEHYTDQIDVFFTRNGRTMRFMTLMAS